MLPEGAQNIEVLRMISAMFCTYSDNFVHHYLCTLWIYLCAKGRIGICWLAPNSLGIGWHRLAPNRAGTAIHAAWLTVSLKGWRLHQAESPSSLIETVAAFTTQGKSTVIGCKITLGRAIHIEYYLTKSNLMYES